MNPKRKGLGIPVGQAALQLKISRERVIRLIQRGELTGWRDPERGWRVDPKALAAAISGKRAAHA